MKLTTLLVACVLLAVSPGAGVVAAAADDAAATQVKHRIMVVA